MQKTHNSLGDIIDISWACSTAHFPHLSSHPPAAFVVIVLCCSPLTK